MMEPKIIRKQVQNTKLPITQPLPTHVLETLKTRLAPIKALITVQEKYDNLEKELKETNKTLERDKTPKDRIGTKARDLIQQRAFLFQTRKNKKTRDN